MADILLLNFREREKKVLVEKNGSQVALLIKRLHIHISCACACPQEQIIRCRGSACAVFYIMGSKCKTQLTAWRDDDRRLTSAVQTTHVLIPCAPRHSSYVCVCVCARACVCGCVCVFRAWTFLWSFRDTIPDAVPLPQHFRRQGWHTVSVGKLYHGRNCVRGVPGCCAANASFSSCIQLPADGDWAGGNGSWDEPPVDFAKVGCEHGANWCARSGVNESEWCDYKIAQASVARVRAHAAQSRLGEPTQPLFLGVGFRDPHLPWASPPRWHDLFDPNKVNATSRGATPRFVSSSNTAESGGVPKVAWQWPAWVGPSTRGGINISDTEWLSPPALSEALGSYMASIAFTDAQLGKIFGALDDVNSHRARSSCSRETMARTWGSECS